MNTSPYEYVLAVARHGSFSRAARSIPISQQGLSKSIAALERDLGFRFFERSGKRVVLTDEGREILPDIEELLASQGRLLAKASEIRQRTAVAERPVTIYASAFFTVGLLKGLEGDLQSRGFPKTTVLELETPQILEQIRKDPSGSIGVANVPVGQQTSIADGSSVVFEDVFSSALAIMATRALLSPRKRVLTARDLRHLPLSYPNFPLLNEMVGELFERYRPENVVLHTWDLARVDESVLAGETAAITDTMTAYLNRNEDDRLYFELDHPVCSNVGFLYSPRAEDIELRRSYMDAIREHMESLLGPYIKSHPPIEDS